MGRMPARTSIAAWTVLRATVRTSAAGSAGRNGTGRAGRDVLGAAGSWRGRLPPRCRPGSVLGPCRAGAPWSTAGPGNVLAPWSVLLPWNVRGPWSAVIGVTALIVFPLRGWPDRPGRSSWRQELAAGVFVPGAAHRDPRRSVRGLPRTSGATGSRYPHPMRPARDDARLCPTACRRHGP